MKEFYTIVLFPGSTGSPKRVQIQRNLFRAAVFSVLAIVVGVFVTSGYFSQRYFQMVGDEAELTELRRASKIRKIQVEKFAQQINQNAGSVLYQSIAKHWLIILLINIQLE